MLTPEEKLEIDKELEKYDDRKAASLEALAIVQHFRGWVSDEALKDIATYLGMSGAELDSICTFYNLIFRKPVGKNVIRMCDSVSCWIRGYEGLVEKIKKEVGIDFGQTTSDNCFTLVSNPCLGNCDKAPTLMVNDDLHSNVTPENMVSILKEYKSKSHHDHKGAH
jgi:NADH-quinone oxidoreductase subunit E